MKAVTKQAISTDPKKFKQVVRETEALCKIRSPFVVHLEGKGQDEGCLYLAIELAEGGTEAAGPSAAGMHVRLDAAAAARIELQALLQELVRLVLARMGEQLPLDKVLAHRVAASSACAAARPSKRLRPYALEAATTLRP